nr:helix-turn-helix domain-containing protein [Planctomycetota bacterium]
MAEITIPSTLLRADAAFRGTGAMGDRIGCGLWLDDGTGDETDADHPYPAVGWVLGGRGEYVDQRDARSALQPGDAYARLPGHPHRTRYAPGYVELWVCLGPRLGAALEAIGLIDTERPVWHPGLDLALLRRGHALIDALRLAEDSELPIVLVEMLAWVAALVSLERRACGDRHGPLIDETCRLLDGGASRERLERHARAHGVGYERLRKLFADRIGCAPGAFRARRRLDRARELLLASDRPVRDI